MPTEAEMQRYQNVNAFADVLIKALDDAGFKDAAEATQALGKALGAVVSRANGHEAMVDNAAQIARMCLCYPSYYNPRPGKPLAGFYLPGAEMPCKEDARRARRRLPG